MTRAKSALRQDGCFVGNCQRAGKAGYAICGDHWRIARAAGCTVLRPKICQTCDRAFNSRWAVRCSDCLLAACSFVGCSRSQQSGGLCNTHYRQKWRGEELYVPVRHLPTETRLLTKRRLGSDDCWEWTGSLSNGYGSVTVAGVSASVHRLAYETWVGPIPAGEQIHHACANRACFNPEHLVPVTQAANKLEMHARRSYEAQIEALKQLLAERDSVGV